MTKKRIVRYMIYLPNGTYEKEGIWHGYKFWKNHEIAFNKKRAIKLAKRMGEGAIIQQVSKIRSGTVKIKEWIYLGE